MWQFTCRRLNPWKKQEFCCSRLYCSSLCACGKDKAEAGQTDAAAQTPPPVVEGRDHGGEYIRLFWVQGVPRLFQGWRNVSYVQISYGLSSRRYAANSAAYKDSMEISFTAEGVANKGSFTVDYDTLQYSGSTKARAHAGFNTLKFWPKGSRTVSYPYGNYSGNYIIYLENFTVTSVSGSIFLKNGIKKPSRAKSKKKVTPDCTGLSDNTARGYFCSVVSNIMVTSLSAGYNAACQRDTDPKHAIKPKKLS